MNVAKRHYEEYWSSAVPPPVSDRLSPRRHSILWERLGPPRFRELLDCGAGTGDLVAAALERGFRASGVELSAAARGRAGVTFPGINLSDWSLDETPWPVSDSSLDVVTCFEVVEHLFEPATFFAEAGRVLRPGGVLFVSTPFHGRAKNLLIALLAFERHYDVEGPHIRFFTDRSLRRLASRAGLRTTELRHIGRGWPVWSNTIFVAEKP